MLWPEAINTQAGFDKAARASNLTYVVVLTESRILSDAQMLDRFKIKNIHRASVENWIASALSRSRNNFQRAARSYAPSDWTCVQSAGLQALLGNAVMTSSIAC